MKKKFLRLTLQLILFLSLLELGLMLINNIGLVEFERPLYSFENSSKYWIEIDSTFGIWRTPQNTFRHRKTCFDVYYETNSLGARDIERNKKSQGERVVVIGDSFSEGWGVNLDERFSNILERATGLEFLNFGIASTGMTQQYFIYENKAKKFEHNAILWVIFPSNDIVEDDIVLHKLYSSDRYRAYWVGSYPNYHLEHGLDSLSQSAYYKRRRNRVKFILGNFTYTYNALKWIKNNYQYSKAPVNNGTITSGYFKFTNEQWLRIKFNIEKMIEILECKKLYIVTVPSEHDLNIFTNDNFKPILTDSLRNLSKKLNFRYLDLLTQGGDYSDWLSLYYDQNCDNHWNEKGHAKAAKKIKSEFFNY
ncbi:MAG: SGNH/GDSL hydrolase family protein [Cytophagia bacterium]|nr:SGNH/GDSL hydrolase family protein [Cytophagia bacterium]